LKRTGKGWGIGLEMGQFHVAKWGWFSALSGVGSCVEEGRVHEL